jgi:hypothetical protein
MRIKLITTCLLFTAAFLSCKKDELSDTVIPVNTYVPLLSKVLIDNVSALEYTYTDSKLLSQEKSKFDFTTYQYNDKGMLVTSDYYGNDDMLSNDNNIFETAMNNKEWVTPENCKKVSSIAYEYDNEGRLSKTVYSIQSAGNSEYSEFSYDNNNRISRQTMYWENTASGYTDYSYDEKGNLIKEMLFYLQTNGAAELITTTTYSFDGQPNPYRATSRLKIPGVSTNLNNIIKETNTIHMEASQGPDNEQITKNSYEYNLMGYPVSKNDNTTYIYK